MIQRSALPVLKMRTVTPSQTPQYALVAFKRFRTALETLAPQDRGAVLAEVASELRAVIAGLAAAMPEVNRVQQ